jgi:hypothetical protein
LLFRADGGQDCRLAPFGELNGIAAHYSSTTDHQDGEAGNRPIAEDGAVRGASGNTESGTYGEIDVIRKRYGVRGGNADVTQPLCRRGVAIGRCKPRRAGRAGSAEVQNAPGLWFQPRRCAE